jgi:pSer/pThr/pTyr-binding forkhead associated (FHA) protein
MVYGRLDVFWADGMLKTYPLSESNVSVGRSSGNTIMLDTGTISRYHFTITNQNGEVFITDLDSVNGTYLDGVKLTINQPQALYGGEEIQIGDLRIIYHFLEETPTRPMAPLPEDATRRMELELPDFKVDLERPEQPAVAPGAHISAELTITNTSQQTERYTVEVTGLPREWVRVDRPELEVAPGIKAPVSIGFKPLRRSDSVPGDYAVQVIVRPQSSPDAHLTSELILHLLPYGGFGMALESRQLKIGETFRLHLHNQGSAPLPLSISGRDLIGKMQNGLQFAIPTTNITLAPDQRLLVQGQVKPRRSKLWGEPRRYPFDLLVRSKDQAGFIAAARGYLLEKPPLPAWAPFAVGGLLAAGLMLIVLAAALLIRPVPQPHIAAFNVNSTRVAQGSTLSFDWVVTAAPNFSFTINGAPVATQNGTGSTQIQVDTHDMTGEVVFGLDVSDGSKTDSATQQVIIYPPLQLSYFTVDPPRVVRYVLQPLTLNWNVIGATSTRIGGLDNIMTSNVLQPSYGAQATVANIGIIPNGPLAVTLLAQDNAGNTLQAAVNIEVVDPQCVPKQDAVTLYDGPSEANQVVGTVPPATNVIVDAQDASGQWLRVQLPGGVQGWGPLASFTCADIFSPANLRRVLNAPTPLPTITLTPTPSASPTLRPSATPVSPTPPAPTQAAPAQSNVATSVPVPPSPQPTSTVGGKTGTG